MDDLKAFMNTTRDAREYKRALAVKLALDGYIYEEISILLDVSVPFVGKWKLIYEDTGIDSLKIGYTGGKGYLDDAQKQEICLWIQAQHEWNIDLLRKHIEETYTVVFKSTQSYYALMSHAKITYKKAQKRNPKKDVAAVEAKKKEIEAYIHGHTEEITAGDRVILFVDECHLLWGNICGYGWGPSKERICLPIDNQRKKQTYYGAINAINGEVITHEYPAGNSEHTVDFIKYLRNHYKDKRITIIWDGASYHRYQDVPIYLEDVNRDLEHAHWQVTCMLFAPNAPEQNPIEDIWLKAKTCIRKYARECTTFQRVKEVFTEAINNKFFDFKKIHRYNGDMQPT